MELSVAVQMRNICAHHAELKLFSRIGEHITNSDHPIARFLGLLPMPAAELESVRTKIFGAPLLTTVGPSVAEVVQLVPDYGLFLQTVAPATIYKRRVTPDLLVHDLVGHLLLDQPTTPRGEIIACAGVAGFSWTAGADYFVNAILMFSLGLPLFEDVVPSRCEIDDVLAAECALAWERAGQYRRQLTISADGVTALAYLLLGHWDYLKASSAKGVA